MIFPIGDDQIHGGARPIFSYTFIAINVFVFLFEISLPTQELNTFIHMFSTIPVEIRQGQDLYTLISSMFLHGGWAHLVFNMIYLWVFADNIEAVIGNFNFLLFYLLGGIAASLIHVGFNLNSMVPSLGASGAISAVLGAYLVMFPRSNVQSVLFLFILIRRFVLPAAVFLGVWIIMQFMNGMQELGVSEDGGGTAWWAHIGGFVFGMFAGLLLRPYASRFSQR